MSNESGASAAEYALLVSLIAAVIIASVTVLGIKVAGLFDHSCDEVSTATTSSVC